MVTDGTGALSVASTAAPVSRPVAVGREVGSPDRRCARPDCTDPARATLSFSYRDQQAVLTGLTADRRPQAYDLCPLHAARTTAPHGWHLRDDRPEDQRTEVEAPLVPNDLGSDRTVAVLAAALRAVPSTSSRDAEQEPTPSTVASTETASETATTEPDPATIDALIDLDDDADEAEGRARTAGLEPAEQAQPTVGAEPEEPADRPAPTVATARTDATGPAARPGGRKPRPVLAARGPEAVPGDRTGPAANW